MGKDPVKEESMSLDNLGPFVVPVVVGPFFFVFLAISSWVNSQRKEREAFYKAESLRRIAESSGDGAKQAIDLLREESRLDRLKKRENTKVSGLILVAIGLGMVGFMLAMRATDPSVPYLAGLIPAFIGAAMLVYVYLMASPVE
jgi:uncharacterized membrane protein YeaQ/YmgE (transglycosylase-associated protein family)